MKLSLFTHLAVLINLIWLSDALPQFSYADIPELKMPGDSCWTGGTRCENHNPAFCLKEHKGICMPEGRGPFTTTQCNDKVSVQGPCDPRVAGYEEMACCIDLPCAEPFQNSYCRDTWKSRYDFMVKGQWVPNTEDQVFCPGLGIECFVYDTAIPPDSGLKPQGIWPEFKPLPKLYPLRINQIPNAGNTLWGSESYPDSALSEAETTFDQSFPVTK